MHCYLGESWQEKCLKTPFPVTEAAFSQCFCVGGEEEAPSPCSLDLVVWLGAQGIIPQSLSAVPSPSFSHSAAETLPVSHISRDTLMCMVLSECEIEVRDQRLEERLYL